VKGTAMTHVISENIFGVDIDNPNTIKTSYQISSARSLAIKENWFRDSIFKNPEIVISPCRSAGITDEEWSGWAKEVAVYSDDKELIGRIDVLLISNSGRIGLVETKLAYNPEKRREVIAQILDYALNLPSNGEQILEKHSIPIINEASISTENEILERFSEADFLLILAGDKIDPKAVKLSSSINGDHLLNPWDLAAIDVSIFKKIDDSLVPDFLIVPTIRGMIVKETRNVVNINITKEIGGSTDVNVKMERIPPTRKGASDLSARTFIWGSNSPVDVSNWAELMTHIVKLSLEDGFDRKELPIPYSESEKPRYREVLDDLYITSAMNSRGARGYCNKILKKLKKREGFLQVTVLDGSVYKFPK
jgi:hypothetical protein